MSILDIAALEGAPLRTDPFDYVIVPNFVRSEALPGVLRDYPPIATGGSHPLDRVRYGEEFGGLIEELDGPAFEDAVSRKFDVDLADRPKTYTVRGVCRARDGKIHTDSVTKIITVLLYLNDHWDSGGGRLRLLRDGGNLEDYAEEVAPDAGNLLIFRRSDRSFHGHAPFEGRRRAVQMNWVSDHDAALKQGLRHWLSSLAKQAAIIR